MESESGVGVVFLDVQESESELKSLLFFATPTLTLFKSNLHVRYSWSTVLNQQTSMRLHGKYFSEESVAFRSKFEMNKKPFLL